MKKEKNKKEKNQKEKIKKEKKQNDRIKKINNKKIKNPKEEKRKMRVIKLIMFICLIIIGIIYLVNLRIKNIYVKGNNNLSDQEIIELLGIEDYPKLFSISNSKLRSRLKVNPLIGKVKITKDLRGIIKIEIEEYDILLKQEMDNQIYLSNLKKIPSDINIVGIPTLTNYVEKDILAEFLTKLNTIDKNILAKISEITYSPNEYDKDLFLFYMNDANYVYITTTRLTNINKYDLVVKSLEGKKGILYLDSGNHFEILN